MAPFIGDANSIPVFLIGDFNTPSHLDWTPATADLHCGYSLNFPVTVELQNAGLIDAYRRVHPDPRQTPGVTWSPIYQTYVYADGKPEPLDRIVASFGNGPGNAKDWIGIYKSSESPGGVPSTAWAYTNGRQSVSGSSGPTSGNVTFGKSSKPVWPLPPGQYKAYFLANEGYDVLAGPISFEVR